MYPDAYTITLLGNEYYIFMHDVTSRLNQSILKIRYNKLELLIDKILEENSWYIDLVELETPQYNEYKSAYDVILSNIAQFSDEDENDIVESCNATGQHFQYEDILNNVRRREKQKNIRAKKFNQIDWQKKRLPELARFVNSIYTSHKVNTMKKEKLIANVRFVGYRSTNIGSDVDRFIKTSNKWLCEFRG